MTFKLGRDSYHKMIVEFVDGNERTRYSIDWRHSYSRERDPQIGFDRLYKLLREWGHRVKTAKIYVNEYGTKNGRLVEKYINGVKQDVL